jgi:hypothetical protein
LFVDDIDPAPENCGPIEPNVPVEEIRQGLWWLSLRLHAITLHDFVVFLACSNRTIEFTG